MTPDTSLPPSSCGELMRFANADVRCSNPLPCPVHPPNDVQRPPLTVEELAEMDRVYAALWSATVESRIPLPNVPRLIAELRAAREEAGRYREWLISEGYNLDADIDREHRV